jgi:NodT family efflux transporter outer membrane factor (OMF) lipoprotein
LGQAPDSVASELIVPHPIPPTPPSVPIGLPGDLLLNRPDVRAAERQLAAATAGIGVAEADLYPKFVINGNIGFSAVDAAKWCDANSLTWGIGPSVSWNILSSGQVQSNINAQKAVRDQDFYTYKQTVLQALDDVDSALATYNQEHAHRRALMAAVADNERAVSLATKLYRNGLTSFLNVLQAQGALYTTQNALVQSNLALSTDLVALYKAIGGGWQVGKAAAK